MNRITVYFTLGCVCLDYKLGWAVSTHTYRLIQESLSLLLSIGCLLLALFIYLSLKGGSLGPPWLFFLAGFTLAGACGALQLLDLFKIIVHEYDLRLATFILTCGSMLFILIGLLLYKKSLE